ncbi:MAG TPA: two-component regulator propeller domain-containing protein [Xanthomonadaceae bacterium]|nr:two-component regulator propeller domain-containing protein [Xanthomonadaceae bacterium]
MKRAWAVVLGLVAGAVQALPETPQFQTLGPGEGLPSVHVYALAQDSAGYLWVATADGLARYDGVGFEVYRYDPRDRRGVPGNVVQALHVDAHDRVWLGIEGAGIGYLDPRNGRYTGFAGDAGELGTIDVWAIDSTPDGVIWFGGYGTGVHSLDPDSGRASRVRRADAPPAADTVISLLAAQDGRVWIGTAAGLDRLGPDGIEQVADASGGLSGNLVLSLYRDRDGAVWVGTDGGLDRIAADGLIAPAPWRHRLSDTSVKALLRDRHGALWLGTNTGLDRVDRGRITPAAASPWREHAVARTSVFDALEDHEGGLWFSALGAGLTRLPANWRNFTVLPHRRDDAATPSTNAVRGADEADDGRIWLVGSAGGIDRLDPRDGRVVRVVAAARLPEQILWSVLDDGAGGAWVGHQRGLMHLEGDGALRNWGADHPTDPAPPGQVDLLLADGDGGLWLSVPGAGLQHRDRSGRVLQTLGPGDPGAPASTELEQLARAPDGRMWIAGAAGLQYRDPGSGNFVSPPGLPRGRIYAFAFASAERIWLQRLDALEAWQREGARWRVVDRFDTGDGVPATAAGALMLDRAGQIWLTTMRGLVRVNPGSGEVRVFGPRDGLPNGEFSNRPALLTRSGRVVAGTSAGVVLFDPAQVHAAGAGSRLVIESASVRRTRESRRLDGEALWQLGPQESELRIAARLLSFADPHAHRYRFRIRGVDADWIDVGARGERVYPRLPPGRHLLEIVAADADGRWTPRPLRRHIVVSPPWWRTGTAVAAYALLALAVALAAVAVWRRRLARAHAWALGEQRRVLAEQASAAKTRFLATMGHEVRTPLTGLLGMSELLLAAPLPPRERGYVKAIERSGRLMHRVVDEALDLARIEAGQLRLEPAPFDLHGLVAEVVELQAPLAQRAGLQLRQCIDPQAPRHVLGDATRVRQILLNLVGNALKFTDRGEVGVEVRAGTGDRVRLAVTDTGPGLEPAQCRHLFEPFVQADATPVATRAQGSGLGLSICRELAQLMGGAISLESTPGVGSRVTVVLPLPPTPAAPMAPVVPLPEDAQAGVQVLVIDDDAQVRTTLCALLEHGGHHARAVPHGLAALSLIQAQAFDVALVDLDLPGIDGLALAPLLSARAPGMALVAITASPAGDAPARARAAGMDRFLRKPVTAAQLAAVVAAAAAEPRSTGQGVSATPC